MTNRALCRLTAMVVAVGFSVGCGSSGSSSGSRSDAGGNDATSSSEVENGADAQPPAPPQAGPPTVAVSGEVGPSLDAANDLGAGAVGMEGADGGTSGSVLLECAPGQCIGSDGLCYGPCAEGTCMNGASATGNCGAPSAGGVVCCEEPGGSCCPSWMTQDGTGVCGEVNAAGQNVVAENRSTKLPSSHWKPPTMPKV